MSLAAWQQTPLLRPPPELPHIPIFPWIPPMWPFSFPGRKARDDDGSSPLTSHSPGITHTHPGNRWLLIWHLFVIYTPPWAPSSGPLLTLFPQPLTQAYKRQKLHTRLALNSLWPIHSAFLSGGSRFWTSASHLCNVEVRGRGLRDRFS